MTQNDEKLRALLRQWQDIEPPTNFEAQVRRRIRTERVVPARRLDWSLRLLWQPAFAAILFGIAVGLWGGIRFPATHRELGFMSDGTLTGGYLRAGEWAR